MLVLLRSLHTILTSNLDCIVLLKMLLLLCVCVCFVLATSPSFTPCLSLSSFFFVPPKKKSKREDNRI